MSGCTISEGGVDNYSQQAKLDESNQAINVYDVNEKFPVSKSLKDRFNKYIVKPFMKSHINAQGIPVPVSAKKFNGLIKSVFKEDADQVGMIFKIRSMLEGNHYVRESLMKEFENEAIKVAGLDPEKVIHTSIDENGDVVKSIKLDMVPISVLRKFYEQTYTMTNSTADENFGGVMGKLRVSLETPRSMRWKDKTGAVAYMVNAVNFFAEKIQQHVTDFMDKNPALNRTYGMADVYGAVGNIVSSQNSRHAKDSDMERENLKKINSFFQKIMNGWMIIETVPLKDKKGNIVLDKNGKPKRVPTGELTINQDYKPVTIPEEGQPDHEMALRDDTYYSQDGMLRYKSTKDLVYAYQNPMSLEKYIAGEGLDKNELKAFKEGDKGYSRELELRLEAKENHISLNKKEVTTLNKEIDRGRVIHDAVFEDVNKQTKLLEAEYLKTLKKEFPNKSDKELKDFFTRDKPLSKGWSAKDKQRALYLKENFTGNIISSVFTPDGNDMNYKKGSFPVVYNESQFIEMLSDAIADLNDRLSRLKDQHKTSKSKSDKAFYLDDIKKTEVALEWAKESLDRYDGLNIDPINGAGRIFDRRSAKHFKHISNVFDIRRMKTDSSVYEVYLRKTYGTLERSRLGLRALQADQMSGGKKLISDYTKALYDRTMHDPNARATMMGVNMSLHNFYESTIGKLPFKISEQKVARVVSVINQFLTARFLGGVSTAALNKTAVVQKIMEVGMPRWQKANSDYSRQKVTWDEMIKRAGILEFGTFFSKSLVQDTSEQLELDEDRAFRLVKLQLKYQKNLASGMSRDNAMKLFRKEADFFVRTFPDAKRLKQREQELYEKYITRMVGKFANYAITKEWTARRHSATTLGKVLQKMSSVQEFYSDIVSNSAFPTMSNTEQELRTNSFVIGVQLAMTAGKVDADLMERMEKLDKGELNEKDVKATLIEMNKAIEVGKDYTRRLDFGLSNQDVGEVGQVLGGFLTKFKYWSQQKFGYDIRTFRDAYWSLKSADKTGEFDKTAIAKTFQELFKSLKLSKKEAKKIWEKNPDIGKLRNFVLTQGLMTVLMDLVIFGPFFGKFIRKIPIIRSFGVTKMMSGATSDLVTLTTTLPIWLAATILYDDDEETMQEGLYYKLRHIPFVGFGTTWTLDQFFFLVSMLADADSKEVAKWGGRAIRPINPLDKVGIKSEEVIEYMWD